MSTLAIIVTYNRKDLLKECIESLLNQKDKGLDILVIDNNSNDGTQEMIKKEFKKIFYKNTGANLGGAGGFNYGIKESFDLSKNYDYLWIMDDDTIPNKNVLKTFLKVAKEKPDFGFLTPKTVWTDGSLCKMNIQSDMKGNFIDETTKNLTKVSRCTFVSCFIRTDVVSEVGLPIKEFFIWSDDTEYTLRISKKYPCYYLNTCKVVHKMNNNNPTKIETDVKDRIDRYFYSFRNRFYIAKKQGILKVIRYHLSICKTFINILLKSKDSKTKRISIVLKGYFKGIVFNPKVEYIEKRQC